MLTLNYAPEPAGFAPHATALADHLARRGHGVTVITGFPFAPTWKRWPEYRGMFSRTVRQQSGVTLHRVTHFVPRRAGSWWQRLLMEASFCVTAAWTMVLPLVRRGSRPSAVLYVGAQPAIAMLARAVAWLSGAPYFVNINDLAAQAAADVGIVRSGALRRILERVEFAAYAGAAGATVLCDSFAGALIERGYRADHIRLIRSPVDLVQVRPMPFEPAHRARLGLPVDAFVVLCAGSMGLKQGLTNVVEAALLGRAARGALRRVIWVLVGDGETRGEIERLIAGHDLTAIVRLLPFQPVTGLSPMFAAADLLLLNQVAAVKDAVIPSKLLTYMAAGKPVLAAVNRRSQGAAVLRAADGGLLVPPEDPAALVAGVQALIAKGDAARAEMGRRNRLHAERCFDQARILAEHEAFLLLRIAAVRAARVRQPELVSG